MIEKFQAGASMIQLYSALSFHGPLLFQKLENSLEQFLLQEKITLHDFLKECHHAP